MTSPRPGPPTGRGRHVERQAAGGQTDERHHHEDDETAPVERRGRPRTVHGGAGAYRRENDEEE